MRAKNQSNLNLLNQVLLMTMIHRIYFKIYNFRIKIKIKISIKIIIKIKIKIQIKKKKKINNKHLL